MKNWILNLNVKKKLMYSFGMLIIFMLAIGGIGYYNMFTIYSNVESIALVHMPATDLLLQIDRDMQQALVAQRTMIFSVVGSDKFSELKKENDENISQAKERWNKYRALEHTPEELTLISKYESEREKWIEISYKIVGSRDSDTPEGRIEAIELSLREGSESFEAAREIINQLTEVTEKKFYCRYRRK